MASKRKRLITAGPAVAYDASNGAGNGLSELTKQLWQAAVELRGSIEPADYKRYVLPIIFCAFYQCAMNVAAPSCSG